VRARSTGNVKLRAVAQGTVDAANDEFAVPGPEGG
jgi:hypothetical protein